MLSQILKTWRENYGNLLTFCTLLACIGACLAYRFDLVPLLEIGRANLPIRRVTMGPRSIESSRLDISVKGFQSDAGACRIAIYETDESFNKPDNAMFLQRTDIVGGEAQWSVEQLKSGKYAVAAYHDLNGNEQLDKSKLGVPVEPYGFSNDARGTLGPPSFHEAAFDHAPPETRIEITLK